MISRTMTGMATAMANVFVETPPPPPPPPLLWPSLLSPSVATVEPVLAALEADSAEVEVLDA